MRKEKQDDPYEQLEFSSRMIAQMEHISVPELRRKDGYLWRLTPFNLALWRTGGEGYMQRKSARILLWRHFTFDA